jgi:hypothetical protein
MTKKSKPRAVALIVRSGEAASMTGTFTRDEIWSVYSAMVDRRMVAVLKKEVPKARLPILRSRRFVFETSAKEAEPVRKELRGSHPRAESETQKTKKAVSRYVPQT